MKEKINSKIKYWQQQESKFASRYMESMKRQDRDQWIRSNEKLKTYREIQELINE